MKLLWKILMAGLFWGALISAEENDLSRLSLGEGWLNAIPIEEFQGRVIVVELWGIR